MEQKISPAVTSEHPKDDGTGEKHDTSTRKLGQPDRKGGIPMSSQPIKRETESPQGNHHSGGAPRTPPVVATVGESNLLYKAQGKEEDQAPIQNSQSPKEEGAAVVKLSADDRDPLSDSGGTKDGNKGHEAWGEKDTQTPNTSLQSSKSGNPPLNSGKVDISALIQSAVEMDETALKDPPEEVGPPPGYRYRKDETEFQKNAPAPKKTGQGDQGKRTTQPPSNLPLPKCSLMQVPPENGVTVVFHVFLVSSLKMEEESLHIRAFGEDLGDFQINCVDMEFLSSEEGRDKKKLLRFIGRCTLGIDRAHKGTHYKYAIIKNGEVVWEELIEFQRFHESTVDRYLKIPDRCLIPGATWHQFDGVSYICEESLWEKLLGWFRSDETANNRATALLAFLPKWKGFVVDDTGKKINATDAIVEAEQVVNCMTNVFIKSSHSKVQRKKLPSFRVHQVLIEYLEPKMEENFAVFTKSDIAFETRISALVSTLGMVTLFKVSQTKLPKEHVLTLLRCLSLEADPTGQKCTMYELVLDEFSEELRSHAAEGIEELCNQIMTASWVSGAETWLFALPLLHFLRGDSRPFEEPGIEGCYEKPEWYGVQKLELKEFQRTAANLNFSEVLLGLTSSFEVDPLLKRSFLHVIPVGKLEKVVESKMFFISDVCVALITSCSRVSKSAEKWNSVLQCLKVMIFQLETDILQTCTNWKTLEFTTSLCLKLMGICLKKLTLKDNLEVICQAIKLLFTSICRQRREVNDSVDKDKRRESEKNSISQLLMSLRTRLASDLSPTMSTEYRSESLERELLVWSKLLWIADENQGFIAYRQFLIDQLTGRARRLEGKYLMEIFCEVNIDEFHTAVEESFTNLAFEAVETIVNSKNKSGAEQFIVNLTTNSCRQRNTRNAKARRSGELLSILLTRSWAKAAENRQKETQKETNTSSLDPQTVQFLLTWKPMSTCLKLIGDESGRSHILSPEGQETLEVAKSLFKALVRNISDGSVTFEVLLLVHNHQNTFLDLLNTTCGVEKNDAERSMAKRIEEIEEFCAIKENVGTFIGMCAMISPVKLTFLKTKATEDVSSIQIRHLCERKDDNQIEITFFTLPPAVKEVLSTLKRVQKSLTFQDLWKKYGNKAQAARSNYESGERQLSLSDVVENVWKPAFKFWNQHAASVKDGTISLEDADELFEGYRGKRKELEEELSCMFEVSTEQTFISTEELKPTIAVRVVQIQRYQQLHQHADAADAIWKFKEAMGFTGDFKVVEELRNQLSTEFKQKPLNSIGEQFSKASRALQCSNVDIAQCFEAIVHSKRLVEWLRSTIKSTQELKVLVDLALISAGESDMETKRITSLHASCLGFAPLIFDLKETKDHKVGFNELIKACEPVWKTVETDRMLLTKLRDTSRHLEWLKSFKESHGSVAMTSLAQAKSINSSGVYVVGHLDPEKGRSSVQGKRLSSKDVIQLTVTLEGESGEEQRKSYSIDELKDLQSKLMLIAGKAEKGKDDVELFVRNLEGVMRLATAYIDLFESGYIHRMDWNQEFHCSKDLVAGESIAKELEEESAFMETCYTNWKKKVSDARKEYKELNFFTTQQLMTLRKEIATICHSNGLIMSNIQVLTLLESVRPNLTSEQLKSAIERAFKDTEILENARCAAELPLFTHVPSQDEMVTRRSVFDDNNYLRANSSRATSASQIQPASVKKLRPKETSKIQNFLSAATDDGYSEQIALAALASLGVHAEEDDLLLWCLEEADEADIEALYEDAKQDPMIAREIFSEEVESAEPKMQAENLRANETESHIAPEMSSTFAENIIEEQKESNDEDNEAEIRQYLTLAQLGNILRELSVLGMGATGRTFPAFLKRGRPNLMLVPKDDILAIVLALYMHDNKQPLPSCEDVLLCTPDTSTEEIELLWRRATEDVQGRFYCLVHADVLDFSVSKKVADMLSLVTQGIADYGLVVICSSENKDRANIVAALDQYHVAAPPCPSPEDLRSYLKRQFQAPPSQFGYIGRSKITWTTAGSLDPEKLCVRVVSSHRGGLGKTLFVRRLTEQLPNLANNDMVMTNLRRKDSNNTFLHVTVPLHGNSTDSSMLVEALLPHAVKVNVPLSRIFHLDVSPSIRHGLDTLLFNLLVLGCLRDQLGRVWRRRSTDLYIIEITTAAPLPTGLPMEEESQSQGKPSGKPTMSKRPLYDLLPTTECQTPRNVFSRFPVTPDKKGFSPLFDVKEFRNAPFQRVYQYLKLSNEENSLDTFTFSPGVVDHNQETCLMLLLRNCGIPDPSWSEIRHFVSFLNSQLRDCEHSFYCDMQLMTTVLGPNVQNLEGFRSFVVRFMIKMSRDFATPSLTEEITPFYTEDNVELERKEIEKFQLRRHWESSPHPYLFFNQDRTTMTFLGFFINSTGDLVDPQTGQTLEKGFISKPLRDGLKAQRVDFPTNIEAFKKEDKINQLCSVMGVNCPYDPDRAYELTTDNVTKILAIYMRFRCNIPVIVMGETGCGKTRLIRYMCGLQAGPRGPRNMLLFKIHGGTTYEDIELKVHQAEEMARANQGKNIDTVLFFDEANTTEALTMIKEVMVDRRINGRPVGQGLERLQFIAACNPYRRHTDDMIHKLESAGLGYHVNADESEDRLGRIPLRHLVYRVHALPGSMRPLIWDFGQLKPDVERLYINQIVSRFICQLAGNSSTVLAVAQILAASQKYMRDQSDECSFVSLRDVERAMQVMVWFYKRVDTLGRLMRKVTAKQRREEGLDVDEDADDEEEPITPLTRALVLAIGVCYHAKLQERREEYRVVVARSFAAPCLLPGGHKQILREISSCQKAVLNELELGPNIAGNTALSENVFMMVVCIELRIPLFVVGKPGSSKSLAKTVVAHNMQGDAAKSELFKTFKQVHMASYQCSPLSTPEGIAATFRQCRKLQEGKNPDKFVSVVVLDEVGLAEDSPLMPLKTLHPLLEDGVTSADDVIEADEKPQRVAFIGISNWALDPAKMNRGIMLSRGVPGEEELIDSAMGICSSDKMVKARIQPLISSLAAGYAELYKEQKNFETLKKCGKEEFFGLRDFYSLIKMVYSIAAKKRPGWHELEHAIRRNFGGLVEGDPVRIFKRYYTEKDEGNAKETSTTIRLIEASLGREDVADRANFSENRYLLILTENYAALSIMQQHLLNTEDDAVVIFGSSFPNDQEYTQICRNINRIKVCMETGRTVILLNLESLYESLYDALNQYYERFGGEKYVDLGLGTHRVKCRVDDGFKLIVIAEKDVVYNKFPIPLINRLEKHFLVTSTSLSLKQKDLVQKMRNWASEFAKVTSDCRRSRDFSIGDAFVGFHEDTIPSIVMQVCNEIERENYSPAENDAEDVLGEEARKKSEAMLLEMATPDAIARLPHTALAGGSRDIWDAYFKKQQHSSLAAFMSHMLPSDDSHRNKRFQEGLSIQVTTHSRLLSKTDLEDICIQTKFHRSTVDFMTLQQFQTEQQFRASVRAFFEHLGGECPGILLVQCDSGDENSNLIAGARHILLEERRNASEMLHLSSLEAFHVVLIIQIPRIAGGCRNFVCFQGGKWISAHIDELRPPGKHTPSIEQLIDRPISEIFGGVRTEEGYAMPAVTVAVAAKLLRNCVQAAACRIDCDTESAERSTLRIELLLDLLPDDPQSQEESFASVLAQRTYNLLKARELLVANPQGWLQSEALSGIGVQEWGTFRKALLQRVFSVVAPILAEIIAFADKDCNLDLLKKNDKTWISRLWLKILADHTVSELSYSDMISPGTNSVRERVQVIGSGAGGHRFSCRFPFSFVIKQRVEKLLKDASSVEARSNTTLLDSLRKFISNSQLGPPLDELHRLNSAGLRYLMDFVHMVYKHSSDMEHQLVYEAILSSARELGTLEDEDGNELLDIALVHVAHSRVNHRLKCFNTLVKVGPDLVPRLREALKEKDSEVLLDVIALLFCLEALESSREMLLSPKTRRTWCDRVLSIRPAVEDMIRRERFGPVREKCSNYGERSTAMLGRCRSMWQRTGAVRLFVEHVTSFAEKDEDVNSENVIRLWKVLGDETDFSTLGSLEAIEKFLLNYIEDVKQRTNEETASELRRRCNAFFMELVSIFSFGDLVSKDLEQEAITLLMRYVIGYQSTQTKDFSPFPDYAIDPTPVVRSFLLQQLLRSSAKLTKLVKEHLGVFLQGAQNLKPEPSHVKEVCFLYVQCREDILISRYKAKVADSKLTVRLKHAKKTCEEALRALSDEDCAQINALSLDGVAKGRYVLSLVVEFLYKLFIEGDSRYKDPDAKSEVKLLLESAMKLCMEVSSSTPQLYLLKQLVRRYGLDCVRTLAEYEELDWILPPEARQQEENIIQDRFLVHGDRYRAVREGLAKTVISGKIQDTVSAITETGLQGFNKNVVLLLVMYRQITMANVLPVQTQTLSQEVRVKLDDFIRNGGHLSETAQPFARELLENSQGGQFPELQISNGKTPQEHTLAEIVIHTAVALQCVGSGSLAQPLYALMTDPSTMNNSFLPTMPEDNYLECMNAIAETMKGTKWKGEWYECGNRNCRYLYFIGECTKPMEKSTCPDCGSVLGGEQHKFLGEYTVSDGKDRTKTGHALGEPASRPTHAEPQRDMPPIVCSLLRIILHSAMIMGASRNPQATALLITPPCPSQSEGQFLWEHLQRDLDVLGRALGRSVDDAALTVHLALARMISRNGGQTANAHDMRLQTRESRRRWEKEFCSEIFVPVITHLDKKLQNASKLLMGDERFGKDPLVRQLYKFDEHVEDLSQGIRPMSCSLWKYRQHITLEDLSSSFQREVRFGGKQEYKVLDAFLKQEHKLRFVQFLPDVVRLQRLLMERFHKRIDRVDAEKYTIREFLKDLPKGSMKEEYTNLYHSFKNAWNSCKSFLSDQGRLRVPQDLCNITMDTDCPIAIVLPSTTGMGVCSTSLTFFLVNTNNESLGAYRNATNQNSPLERVSVSEVTLSQLIAYDPERDMLPLILSHCNYSLEVGKETLVHYDLAALERQLIDRLLRGRPFVEFKEERFAFSRDTRDDAVFTSLTRQIPQESISRVVESRIINDLQSSLSDICGVMSSLDIATGFLASSGGQPERPLKWYLHEVLKLPKDRGLKSATAEQHCSLSHTLALWRLMALERAKIKSRTGQEPFEQLPGVFKAKLCSSERGKLNRVLRKSDMGIFLPQLLQIILLNVKKDGETISTMSFEDYLQCCLADKGLKQIPGTEKIPESIKMAHLKEVWDSAVQLSDDFHKDL